MSALASVRHERAIARFDDGSQVHLEENELGVVLTRRGEHKPFWLPAGEALGLNDEYNYLLVGLHWEESNLSLVMLPHEIHRATESGEEERNVYDYDRLAHIDRAIEALQRARAVLER